MPGSARFRYTLLTSALIFTFSSFASFAQTKVARLPAYFEPNRGQAPRDVRYLFHDSILSGEFLPDGVSLTLPVSDQKAFQVRMQLVGECRNTAIEGQQILESHTNYLIGNDPAHWLRSVPNFAKVRYAGIYPGIDLVFYGNGHTLEQDFEVQPGKDPKRIAFHFQGAHKLTLAADGSLLVTVAGGEVRFTQPIAYQLSGGARRPVDARFLLRHDGTVRFRVGRYDPLRPLVIDPAISYATYLDTVTDSDWVSAIAVDSGGNTYITGITFNAAFPVTAGSFSQTCPACTKGTSIFVTKLNAAGTAQVYSTYLGGSSNNQPAGLAVDSNGNAIVTGYTQSTDFPVKNPVATVTANNLLDFGFISSLSADGSSLNYSSLLGGQSTGASAVAVDTQGNAYITGTTDSPNYPVTPGALQAVSPQYPDMDVFVSKFLPTGALGYSAIIGNAAPQGGGGGSVGPSAIAVDGQGNAYITGGAGTLWPTTANAYATQIAGSPYRSVFVTEIKADGSAMVYSTLVGAGYARSIALDSSQNAYVTGQYDATTFPVTSNAYMTTAGACCAFLSKISSDGSQLAYSSFFGEPKNNGTIYPNAIALDPQGDIWLAGYTNDYNFPLVNPVEPNIPPNPGLVQGVTSFLSEFDPTATQLKFSSYIGDVSNNGLQIALDQSGKMHVAGTTGGPIYTTPGAFIGSVSPAKNLQFIFPYTETIDPAPASSAVCLGLLSQFGLSFGNLIPQATASKTVQVQNCGTASLTVNSISSSNSAFTAPPGNNNCIGSIAAGSSCSFGVQFEPTAAQSYSSVITIASNAATPVATFIVNGTGAEPVASFGSGGSYPSTIFQPLLVGQTSPVAYVQFFNNGTVPLTINLSQDTISGDFALASGGSCTATLPAHGQCAFAVTFTPTAAGTRTGFLSVSSNDPVNPIVSAVLSGTAYSAYPAPTITALLNPSYPINSGTNPISISVEGTGFFPGSVVYVNGTAQTTTYQSNTFLKFNLNPTLLNAMGQIPVTVQNPSPGGGASAAYPLIGYISVPITASALIADPVGGLLYAAIPSSASQNPNTVIPITPSTGAMGTPVPVASNPRALAVSDDGTELYVASDGVLQRFNLKTMTLEKSFNLPIDPMWGQTYVQEMHVVPGSPQSIVVELFANVDPAEDGLALYNDSGLVNWLPGVGTSGSQSLEVNSFTFTSPSAVYALPGPIAGAVPFAEVQVSPSGLAYAGAGAPSSSPVVALGNVLRSDGSLLYTNDGQVWDPSSQQLLGTYLDASTGTGVFVAPSVIPETSASHTYFLDSDTEYFDEQAVNIDAYNQVNFAYLGSVPFLNLYGPDVADLVRWGNNGFAFRSVDITGSQSSANQIVIVTSNLVNGSGTAAPLPVISSLSPSQVYSGGAAFTLQVNGSGFTSASTVVVNGTPLATTYASSSSLSAQVPASDLYEWGQLNVQVVTPAPGGGTSNYAIVDISPAVALIPSTLVFGNLVTGTSSSAQTAYLYNQTTSALAISSIAAGGDFTETNNCGSSLAAQSSCTINVVLKPSTTGFINGTLTVADGAPSATQTASLEGFGFAPFAFAAASGGSLSATVSSGATATYNLQLSSNAGFSGSVNLSCSGAPQYATCSVSPPSVTLTSGGSGTFAVSVSTETTTTAAVTTRSGFELAGFGMLALLLIPLARSRRRARHLWLGLIVFVSVCLASGITACGGGGGGGGGSTTKTYTTPKGTYTLTLTASSSTATSKQSLTLVVN
jgi:hypothetical protein